MATQFKDPRGEYSKQCPYCLEYITVDHLNRVYCPEKNGIKDFCKNRFKRLKNNLMEGGVVIDKPDSEPLKISFTRDQSQSKKTIDDAIHESVVERNKKILDSILGQKEIVEIGLEQLKKEGYEIDFYESEHNTPSGYKVYTIGSFSLTYLSNEKIYLTLKNSIDI